MVEGPEFRHILLATDGSEPAARAFEKALALARAFAAHLTLLTVAEEGDGQGAGREEKPRLMDEMAGRVEEFQFRARQAGVPLVTAAVEVGVPYARILDYTQREEVDLVVLGATGWGDAALRLGENAGRVTRYSGCCVLVVR